MVMLNRTGPNSTEITDGDRTVLFSYSTPVAVHVEGKGYYVTSAFHSRTTSGHVSRFCEGYRARARRVPQEVIARMASGGSLPYPNEVEG